MADRLVQTTDLPTLDAGVEAVSDAARSLRSSTSAVAETAASAVQVWAGIGAVLHAPGATDRLRGALRAVSPVTSQLRAAGSAGADALETFSDELHTIRRARRGLVADIETLHTLVRSVDSADPVPPTYLAENNALLDRAHRLRRRWARAQDDLADALRVHAGGGSFIGVLGIDAVAPALLAPIDFGSAAQGFRDAARLPLLAELAASGPGAVRRWLRDHPAERRSLINEPPAADTVRRWWSGLGAAARDALVSGAPRIIGNLEGVRYADRGQANRNTLDAVLPRARARHEELSARVARGDVLSIPEQAELARATELIAALGAICQTLGDTTALAPRTIISLTLGRPPLAAVAVGNMDTASRVTVNVPGMGNTVASSMRGWAAGAENLLAAEQLAAEKVGVRSNLATVAWIGYDTPDPAPSSDVLSSAKARAGAACLSDFLSGIGSTRGWSGGENVSVVGHSYGTTTATLALVKTPVSNVTLLASAGIDKSIPSAATMDVPSGHVWTSQAKSDFIANMGRGSVQVPSGVTLGDQPQVHADREVLIDANWLSQHPLNPADPAWGARTFSSNPGNVDGRWSRGSDGHDADPASIAALTGERPTKWGYLDVDTTSLRNAAYTSLGFTPDRVRIP